MQARIPRLSFSVESQIADAAVPPLMLISLVENAIKHGIEPKVGAAHIAVKVSVIETQETQETPEPRMLEMRVEDDGVGFGGHNSGSGIGLANIHQRLAAMYGERASLLLKARPEGGVAAIITIPLEQYK
jgi:LytS/YehU family sensor histidine kinase